MQVQIEGALRLRSKLSLLCRHRHPQWAVLQLAIALQPSASPPGPALLRPPPTTIAPASGPPCSASHRAVSASLRRCSSHGASGCGDGREENGKGDAGGVPREV